MSKYAALRDHLLKQKSDHWNADFSEIEDVLGFSLPASARKFPAWWANQNPRSHVQCSGWLDAGWRASGLNLTAERVTFLRSGDGSERLDKSTHTPTKFALAKSALEWKDVLKPDQNEKPVVLNMTFSWRQLGNIFIDQKDRLAFPKTPLGPAIYRFTLKQGDNAEYYIGETEEVSRRFQHYRTPSVTQRTNQRLNSHMMECLRKHGSVEIAVIECATTKTGNSKEPLDLTEKLQRRLIEHAAIVSAQRENLSVLNL